MSIGGYWWAMVGSGGYLGYSPGPRDKYGAIDLEFLFLTNIISRMRQNTTTTVEQAMIVIFSSVNIQVADVYTSSRRKYK